jgi:hypothetical protein
VVRYIPISLGKKTIIHWLGDWANPNGGEGVSEKKRCLACAGNPPPGCPAHTPVTITTTQFQSVYRIWVKLSLRILSKMKT